jgi:hypothetical protein
MGPTDILLCILNCLIRTSGAMPNDPSLRSAIVDLQTHGEGASQLSKGTALNAQLAEFFNFDSNAYPPEVAQALLNCVNNCVGSNVATAFPYTDLVVNIYNDVTP